MNNRMIVYMIGRMLGVEGLLLLVPALVSFLYGEQSGIAFLLTAAILLVIFLLAGRKKPKDTSIYGKEGLSFLYFCSFQKKQSCYLKKRPYI